MLKWWNGYWFRPAPYLDLAMVRIVMAGTLLLLLLFYGNYSMDRFLSLAAIPDDLYNPITVLRIFILPFGMDYRPSIEVIQLVRNVAIATALLALIGLATRVSVLVCVLCTMFICAWAYSFADFHHTEAPLLLALGVLAFAPAGQVLSVDSILRRWRKPKPSPDLLHDEGPMAGWAIRLIQWLLVLIYLSAIMSKLLFRGGLEWLNGYTLQYYLIMDVLRKGTLFGQWFSEHHNLVMLSQFIVVGYQGTFALAVLFPRLRWIYVPIGLGFHTANWVFLNAPFPEWMAVYAVFIPWRRLFQLLLRREAEVGRDAQVAT